MEGKRGKLRLRPLCSEGQEERVNEIWAVPPSTEHEITVKPISNFLYKKSEKKNLY